MTSVALAWPVQTENFWTVRISRSIFFVYIIFVLTGGAMPFQDKITQVHDISTSNLLNQVIDSLVPFIAVLCLWPRRKQLFVLLREEKYLTLFLLWCFCSIAWADFPFETLKRSVRVLGSIVVILSFLLNLRSSDEALKYFKIIFAVYVPLSLIAIAVVPSATQWEFPAWRGLAPHKNTLGQISVISVIVWMFALYTPSARRSNYSWLFLVGSLILLAGSKSTTALVCFLFLVAITSWLFVDRRLQSLQVGRLISLTMFFCLLLLFFLLQALDLDALQSFTQVFGKDSSFTGRTDLWDAVLEEARTHLFLGCGFGGFWLMHNPAVLSLYQDDRFVWLPNEAHQGYIDLLNETGIVGLSLVLLMIAGYFKKLSYLAQPHSWKWLLLSALVINLQESTLFRSASLSGWMFLFSYLALYRDLNRHTSQDTTKFR